MRSKVNLNNGGWTLVILGVVAILIATVSTGVSLAIYHNSGDIYLDRSRPGFLPDEEEIEDADKQEDFLFEKSGKLTIQEIEEYLANIEVDIKAIDAYQSPFDAEVLSDKSLDITDAAPKN